MKINKFSLIFLFVSCFVSSGLMWQYKEVKTKYLIEKIERELADSHKVAVDELRQKEKQSRDVADAIGIKYYELQKKHEDIYRYNNELAGQLERLHNEVANRGKISTGNGACPTSNSASIAELSREDIKFLIEFAREADEAARYGMMCFDWIKSK